METNQIPDINLMGSIDLMKLKDAGVFNVPGKTGTKKCVVIPLEDNDIYVKVDESLKVKSAFIGLNIIQRREVSEYKDTHYCKQSLSKEFREAIGNEEVKKRKNIYLGAFKPYTFENKNEASIADAPVINIEDNDDLPF